MSTEESPVIAAPEAPAPVPEPQAPPPSIAQDILVTTIKEQVVIKKTQPATPPPAEPAETRPRKPKSQTPTISSDKGSEYKSNVQTTKVATTKKTKAPRDYGDRLTLESLSREFRGTSPSVLENIATHPLLFERSFEPLRRPHLSAKSKKVIRDTADLALFAPGLKSLLEVQ